MATVIDSLVVMLSIDPSGFKKGQAQIEASRKKMSADANKTAKDFDAKGKAMAQSISMVRNQVIGLFAAFTAGRGLKEFIADLTRSDAALGRAATNIGLSASQLSAWQGVAQRTGGSAEGITSSMNGLAQQFQQLYLTGQSGVIPYFRALGVQIDQFVDNRGNIRDMTGLFLRLSDAFKEKGLSSAGAQAVGAGLGIDSATINAIYMGRTALEEYLATSAKFAASKEDTAAAQQRQNAFSLLGAASESLGRKLLTAATPAILAITNALAKFAEWAGKHQPLIEAAFLGITAAVVTFAAVLAAPLAGIAALSVAIASAIAAIALLYDDWKAWTEGGKSAFGGFWQYFADKWASIRETVLPAVQAVEDIFSDLWGVIKSSLKLIVDLFIGSGDDIADDWANLGKHLLDIIIDLATAIPKIWSAVGNAMVEALKSAFDWIGNRIEAFKDALDSIVHGFSKAKTQAAKDKFAKEKFSADAPISAGPSKTQAAKDKATGQGIVDYFVSKGWTPAQAAGIAANLLRESAGSAGATGDGGKAYGLGQWHPDRQANFTKWAGHDIRQSTLAEQMAFVNYELTEGSEKRAGQLLRGAGNASAAGSVISRYYERPADASGEAAKRGSLAQALGAGAPIDAGLTTGAGVTAASSTTNNSHVSTNGPTTLSIGEINLNGTNVTDSKSFAATVVPAIEQHSIAAQANTGLTG